MKKGMRHTRDVLMAELWTSLGITALMVVLFESEAILPGFLSDAENVQLLVGMIMVVVVLAFIPLSLYLFKIKYVNARLTGDESSAPQHLLFWGSVRMMMLCLPMVINMFLYYAFGENVRFFYLSVICALCLFMVYPTLTRCLAETGIDCKAENYDPDPADNSPRSY